METEKQIVYGFTMCRLEGFSDFNYVVYEDKEVLHNLIMTKDAFVKGSTFKKTKENHYIEVPDIKHWNVNRIVITEFQLIKKK